MSKLTRDPSSVMALVHLPRRLVAAGLTDDAGRHAGNRFCLRHRRQHHRPRGDLRAVADFDVAGILAPAPIKTP